MSATARLAVALGTAGLALAMLVPPAHAAPATRIFISQNVVSVIAPAGQANSFQVSTDAGLVVIDDIFHPTAPVAPCRSAPVIFHEHQVVCPITATTRIYLDAGDGNDGIGIHGIGGTVLLGAGDDSMAGATGNLTIDLGPGNDFAAPNARQGIVTSNGPDEVIGGPGVDKISYLQHFFGVHVSLDDVANDGTRAGAEGDNIRSDVENIEGSFADDRLYGSAGANEIRGAFGSDQLNGLGGNDTFLEGHFFRPYDRPDTLSGGDGFDTANYGGNVNPRWISLDNAANDGESGENDDVRSDVEKVIGGAGKDVLTGNAASNTLIGGAGDDELVGGAGDDVLRGEAGTDRVDGGPGTDTCDAEVRQNCP